jgi:hypothetical protein
LSFGIKPEASGLFRLNAQGQDLNPNTTKFVRDAVNPYAATATPAAPKAAKHKKHKKHKKSKK